MWQWTFTAQCSSSTNDRFKPQTTSLTGYNGISHILQEKSPLTSFYSFLFPEPPSLLTNQKPSISFRYPNTRTPGLSQRRPPHQDRRVHLKNRERRIHNRNTRMATSSQSQGLSKYVTLISGDGFEFVVLREAACVSGAIRRMLDPTSESACSPLSYERRLTYANL